MKQAITEKKRDAAIHAEHVEDVLVSEKAGAGAKTATEAAHEVSLGDAIKAYPMAIFWCLVISTCVIMEGFDQILVQSFYAYPQFQIKYGEYVGYGTTGYQLTAAWQAGLTNASGVGAFFGAAANG